MAINKIINYRAKIDLSYWMIKEIKFNKFNNTWEVQLGGYISQDTRIIEASKPFTIKRFSFENIRTRIVDGKEEKYIWIDFTKSLEETYKTIYQEIINTKIEFMGGIEI